MLKKLWEWIKNPHGWQLAVVYVLTLVFVGGAIAACIETKLFGYFSYFFYALSALFFGYSVYTIVIIAPKIKRGVVEKMKKRKFTGKLVEEYDFRTIVFAAGSFAISSANAAFNGTIGIINLSAWYCALGAYYLLLTLMRGGVLLFHRRKNKLTENETLAQMRIREIKTYRTCGIFLVLLPVIMSAVIIETIISDRTFIRSGLMIYVTAAYTVYKLSMSVYNFFKARKGDDMTVRAIRNVNLADAFVSILALQTAMFHEFSTGEDFGAANAALGGVICILTAVLGIVMIVYGNREIKKVKAEGEKAVQEQ